MGHTDHGHAHSHTHGGDLHKHRGHSHALIKPGSLLALSAFQRLIIVLPALILLWLAVWWAMGAQA
ncbi:hypothetical protein KSF73_09730 [Burkholderiaceae bacterium DAT-1]|nr:hypothetical protein [Burkholderiaceae bacterium DAT-1]